MIACSVIADAALRSRSKNGQMVPQPEALDTMFWVEPIICQKLKRDNRILGYETTST